jgi:hypothetical protein
MGMMDSMMKGMIKALPVTEREALMLKMMPDMMKQVNVVKMTPNMLKEVSGRISLLSIYQFLQILLKDDEALDRVKVAFGNLKGKIPAMMQMMHPMMLNMMSSIMPKMMGFMATMMPNMKDIMPQVMEESMIPMIREDPAMRAHMLGMMQTMFPHCAMNMFPMIEHKDRIAFIQRLAAIMEKSANIEMDTEGKISFDAENTGAVKGSPLTDEQPN